MICGMTGAIATTQGTPSSPSRRMAAIRFAPSAVVLEVTAGTLPAGLELSAQGLLTGTPSAWGDHVFEVRAVDDPREAVRGADLLSSCTDSMGPVYDADWIEPGRRTLDGHGEQHRLGQPDHRDPRLQHLGDRVVAAMESPRR